MGRPIILFFMYGLNTNDPIIGANSTVNYWMLCTYRSVYFLTNPQDPVWVWNSTVKCWVLIVYLQICVLSYCTSSLTRYGCGIALLNVGC